MANKNTRRRIAEIATSIKQGVRALVFDRSYTQKHGNSYANISVDVPHDTSKSPARNMQQRVFANAGGGDGSSITRHVPIHNAIPVVFKNHGYLIRDEHGSNNYRQDAGAMARA